MRRKRSDELPRFAQEDEALSFRWRRRYAFYLVGVAIVCWILYPSRNASSGNKVNWANYAYSLYATDTATLCHSVLVFDALARLGSTADRVLFYPKYWDMEVESTTDRESQLLVLARDQYKVKLHPTTLLKAKGRTGDQWTGIQDSSVTKLMAFSLEYYDRVIALDSDITLLQSLDELFLLPQTPIAMPRTYWGDRKPWPLSSMLMVIKPSVKEYERFRRRIGLGGNNMLVKAHKFDMEIVNERFEDNAMVLPHRPYALVTGEFARHDHSAYLGSVEETWNAEEAFKEAKLVHFSDAPLPPPWIMWPLKGLEEMQPDCGGSHEGTCAERRIWKQLYDDFRHKRRDICKLLSVPAPEWDTIKAKKPPQTSTKRSSPAAPHAEDSAAASVAS